MPHLTLEYSANIEEKADIEALCRDLHSAVMASGLFELGAVRVRAFCARNYAVADLDAENSFLDMIFRVGSGRSVEQVRAAGDMIFAAAVENLSGLLAEPHFALSLEVREIDSKLSWKRNAIHRRLRAVDAV